MSDDESVDRVRKLFIQKLAAQEPEHPWVLKDKSMKWQEPYVMALGRSMAMDIELYKDGQLLRYGRVSWPRSDDGLYDISITIQSEHGLGLYCWPSFRVLSDAQDFVERLMAMSVVELKALHGTQWPNVIL